MDTVLVEHLIAHLAKCNEVYKEAQTAYGNAPKGTVRTAQRKMMGARREVFYTRGLLYAITGRHY